MDTMSVLDGSPTADPQPAPPAPDACDGEDWTLRKIQQTDALAVKTPFSKLHGFNAALDPCFALAEDWEAHFDAAIQQARCGAPWILACRT